MDTARSTRMGTFLGLVIALVVFGAALTDSAEARSIRTETPPIGDINVGVNSPTVIARSGSVSYALRQGGHADHRQHGKHHR